MKEIQREKLEILSQYCLNPDAVLAVANEIWNDEVLEFFMDMTQFDPSGDSQKINEQILNFITKLNRFQNLLAVMSFVPDSEGNVRYCSLVVQVKPASDPAQKEPTSGNVRLALE